MMWLWSRFVVSFFVICTTLTHRISLLFFKLSRYSTTERWIMMLFVLALQGSTRRRKEKIGMLRQESLAFCLFLCYLYVTNSSDTIFFPTYCLGICTDGDNTFFTTLLFWGFAVTPKRKICEIENQVIVASLAIVSLFAEHSPINCHSLHYRLSKYTYR